ncbi:Hint domain-containing protein [Palleronia caenipelagi]|uniref:Calcium-binding protein n=1 Tax=Palleronia caenipelagi TaxID=2489174 RepID=A0A547PXJ1_9RHOB|nr:Hint domain-containing protein [Palleronia caenipelagi]TRD18873.1 calcium-binding protein [Palleronia caenipelagi]
MADFVRTILYLGNRADADTSDISPNLSVENPGAFLGVYGSSELQVTTVTLRDLEGLLDGDPANSVIEENVTFFNDGSISDPDSEDRVIYDIGAGQVTVQLDSLLLADVTLTLGDNSTLSFTNVVITQMTNGDVFLNELPGGDETAFDNINIQSINVTAVRDNASNNFAGWIIPPDVVNLQIVCFARGTMILTDAGEVPVENLTTGDQVLTLDHGFRPIRWICDTSVCRVDLAANDRLRPVIIRAGALGKGQPRTDLRVSRQHRILLRSDEAQDMFGSQDVLLPAIKLVGLDGISIDEDCEEIEYWHILLDKHEIIWANGTPSETLSTGPEAMKSFSLDARRELGELFPELFAEGWTPSLARPVPKGGAAIRRVLLPLEQDCQSVSNRPN